MANNYPILKKRCAFLAKVEATPGTPETLSLSTNGIRLLGASIPEEGYLAENERDEAVTGSLDTVAPADPAGRFYRARLRWAGIGAGAAYAYTNETTNTLPECHPLLRAAGYALAVTGGGGSEVATYSLSDDPTTAITAHLYVGGKLYIFTFAVIEGLTITQNAGGFPIFEGTLVGIASTQAETDLASVTYDTFAAAPYPIIKGASALVIGSVEPQFQSIVTSLNNVALPNLNGNATDGHGGYRTGSRRVTIAVTARVPAVSTWDPRADKLARTSFNIATRAGLAAAGGQYKRLKTDSDAAVVTDVQMQEGDEYIDYVVTYLCTPATVTSNLIWD